MKPTNAHVGRTNGPFEDFYDAITFMIPSRPGFELAQRGNPPNSTSPDDGSVRIDSGKYG